ncbi:Uncharacterised protein [Paenibacillus macerans]|uniref:Enoyl-CoA hydratase/carnithine racemase domain protein n=1 Tax=Paenibacillus macerans TaxID=44252 RepID=A0A090Z4Y5_PAEMA|nr:enoyl-CoA hydratase/carnithine racemase domain protein [Paenibacillus macerans]SUA85508.1 Uncharacterised protein [Paenibacillus macerans]
MGCTTICSGFWVKNEQKMGLKNAIFVLENLIFCIDIPTIGRSTGRERTVNSQLSVILPFVQKTRTFLIRIIWEAHLPEMECCLRCRT